MTLAVDRIAFVTRRFHELRGLMPATFGGALIVAALAAQASGASGSFDSNLMLTVIFANSAYIFVMRKLDAQYRETFGAVVIPARAQFLAGLPHFVVVLGAGIDLVLQASGWQAPSATAVGFACSTAWIAVRDFRWRSHYVAAAAAGLAGAIVTATALPQAFLLAYMLIGLGLVGAGLCDHYLLATSLGSTAPAEQTAGWPPANRTRVPLVALVFAIASASFLYWDAWSRGFLPALLMLAVLASQVVVSIPDALRAVREMHRTGRVTLPPAHRIHIGPGRLALLYLIAVAAVMEGALGFRGALPASLAAALSWMAVENWPHGKRFALAAAAALVLVPVSRALEPSRAFALLLFVTSLAFIVERFMRHGIVSRHVNTI
jgi:hypothetical protein